MVNKGKQVSNISKDLHPIIVDMLEKVRGFKPIDLFIYDYNDSIFYARPDESPKEQREKLMALIDRFEKDLNDCSLYHKLYGYNIYAFKLYEEKKYDIVIEKFKEFIGNDKINICSYFIDTYASCLVMRGKEEDLKLAKVLYDFMLKYDKINLAINVFSDLIKKLKIKDNNWEFVPQLVDYSEKRKKLIENKNYEAIINLINKLISNKSCNDLTKSYLIHEKSDIYIKKQNFNKAKELLKEAIRIDDHSYQNSVRKCNSLEYLIWIYENQEISFDEQLSLYNQFFNKCLKSNKKFKISGTKKGKNAFKIIEEGIED